MKCRPAVFRSAFVALLLAGLLPQSTAGAVNGSISPNVIEIDANANLYPATTPNFNNGAVLNPGANVDWVRDNLANTDPSAVNNSIATGIVPGVTGASGGRGHWYGARIVDGIAGNDQDMFLTGGKEDDLSTWNIGAGTVGSSKYDISQAYLANNRDSLFFGMERLGNNGTTAFDFEFNQRAPAAATPLFPTRTVGDVLFTFEMSGSGTSGSATPHYFIWNGSAYIEKSPVPASLISSINNDPTPSAPWGYVDSRNQWVIGTIPRFQFAEAAVDLSEAFPNFVPCNARAFVQVRTRASATANSDLKDTTHVFEYQFGGPTAAAELGTSCGAQFTYTADGSVDSTGGTNLTYRWDFKPASGVTLAGSGVTGPDANGLYHSSHLSGSVQVTLPAGVNSTVVSARVTAIEGTSCTNTTAYDDVTVLRPLSAAITSKVANGSSSSVTLTGSSDGATSLQWQVLRSGSWTSISGATASTYTYARFESDATPTVTSVVIDGVTYQAKVYTVQVRLRATRVANGDTCAAASAPVTLKKVIAVDP